MNLKGIIINSRFSVIQDSIASMPSGRVNYLVFATES